MGSGVMADIRYGLRLLGRNPGFTAVAVLTLALGIGANTAMFTVVNALLVRALPFSDSERLMVVLENFPARNVRRNVISPANYLDWQARSKSFESLAAFNEGRWILSGIGQPEELVTHVVTRNFFDVLRVQPLLGRSFTSEEDRPGGAPVAMISHRLWRNRLGGRTDVVGSRLTLDGQALTVIGVMPADFRFLSPNVDLWAPMQLNPAKNYRERMGRSLRSVGRLRDGVSESGAASELAGIAAALETQYPATNKGWGVDLVPLRDFMVGDVRQPVVLLMGAVAFVLLIACANVANLLLARAAARQREIAVRMAIGGGRGRILRQMLTESLLLAVAGGVLGAAISLWAVDALIALAPRSLPMKELMRPDWTVFAFSSGLTLLTGLVFGMLPAIQASRTELMSSVRSAGRGITGKGNRTRGALVVVEVALSLLLLAGAGLLIRSFGTLTSRDPGLDAERVTTMRFFLPREGYPEPAHRIQFFARALTSLRAIPGVESATGATFLPGTSMVAGTGYSVEGRPPAKPGEVPIAQVNSVDADFFSAMRVRLLSGRYFNTQDNTPGMPRVFVVSEHFARTAFPGDSAIGKRIRVQMGDDLPGEIVGVVADLRQTGLAEEAQPLVYYPTAQLPIPMMNLLVRNASGTDAAGVTEQVRRAINSLDPNLPLADIRPLERVFAESIARVRFATALLSAFSGLALLLAAVGLYGVLSYLVTLRTMEIGVRMALGARPADVVRLMMREGVTLVLTGALLGSAASVLLAGYLESLLYGVKAQDPLTWAAVVAVLMASGAAASWVPSWRAARLQPSEALRGN